MRNDMTDGKNNASGKAFEGSHDTIVTNSDADINDLGKLKTEVMAFKMFITGQLYLLKQSAVNQQIPECNCNSKSNSYIKSLIEQIHYLKVENKMKNSFTQSLLF